MNKVDQFRRIGIKASNLFDAKNKDYNNSYEVSWDLFGLENAFGRIFDKLMRINNIYKGAESAVPEKLDETAIDLVSYSIMLYMYLEDHDFDMEKIRQIVSTKKVEQKDEVSGVQEDTGDKWI